VISQKDFWEDAKVFKRRHPSHPVIEAVVKPKINIINKLIRNSGNNVDRERKLLLDIGSGNGYFSYYLNNYFKVTCLDFSRNMLFACPLDKKIQASAINLPLKDNSYDVVFCANLLHHTNNPSYVLNEMLRATSHYIVIIEPNVYNPFMFLLSIISKEERSVQKYTSKYLLNLLNEKAKILFKSTHGFILPNKTPLMLLPLLIKIEPVLIPRMYHILIAEKNGL
jgi:ubiquinone/menaquinone biosynthesis C-methylase UbiE